MGLKTIPHNNDMTGQFLAKARKEGYDRLRIDMGIRVESTIQTESIPARDDTQSADNGDFLMRAGFLIQNRCMTTGVPGSPDQRRHQHATFVDEDDMRSQFGSFFLMRGQSPLIHSLILASLRSIARRSGFWGVQPRSWRIRPIWST